MREPQPLDTSRIQGDDITANDAMATALDWAKSYHDVKDQYNTLRGWVAGVEAGQKAAQAAIDQQQPPAPQK